MYAPSPTQYFNLKEKSLIKGKVAAEIVYNRREIWLTADGRGFCFVACRVLDTIPMKNRDYSDTFGVDFQCSDCSLASGCDVDTDFLVL